MRNPTEMNPSSAAQSGGSAFVELGRIFVPLSWEVDREELAATSYLWVKHFGGRTWDKIHSRRLTVILGEPGSGKTSELRHRAALLTSSGKPAFFIRLDELVHTPFASVLGAESMAQFTAWREGVGTATFLLDSVDESKLKRVADFYTALRRFRDAIGPSHLPRSSIILSSRISEWHPETDGREVSVTLGVRDHRPSQKQSADDNESLLVVQLAPLDREQVEQFARAQQIADVEAFLRALDDAHAWEFARRPIDVVALAGIWGEQGRIGTLTELVEFDIDQKLREPRHRSGDLLSSAEARAGAEALAAAAVFGHHSSIKVPDHALIVSDAFDGRSAVPDSYTDDKYQMLLTRPLFDGASFGRIRFHHRRIREYLAATWISRRMEQGCPIDELEALFFVMRDGSRVIRASMSPIAPWLAGGTQPWNHMMRQWLLEAAPALHLRYGDPQALTTPEKRAVLNAVVTRTEGRSYAWLGPDEDALARLADPVLAPDISAILLSRSSPDDLREAMITIVIRGKLTPCIEPVLQVLANPDEGDRMRNYAGIALRECALPEHKRRWAEIVTQASTLPQSVSHAAVENLLPDFLDDQTAIEVLLKSRNSRRGKREFPRLLSTKLKNTLLPERCGALLAQHVARLRQCPHFQTERGHLAVSQEYGWTRGLLIPLTLVLLRKNALTEEETENATMSLWYAYGMREDSTLEEGDLSELERASTHYPEVRRRVFWRVVDSVRDKGRPEHHYWGTLFWHSDEIMRPTASDLPWLVADCIQRPLLEDRALVLRLTLERWMDEGRARSLLNEIRRAVASDKILQQELRRFLRSIRFLSLRRWWHRTIWRRVSSSFWWDQQWHRTRVLYFKIYNRVYVSLRVRRIAQGKCDLLLWRLVDSAEHSQGGLWSSLDWTKFEESWGRSITHATHAGLKTFWRRHVPTLPHEKPKANQTGYDVVLGLTGLHLAWDAGELRIDELSDPDVRLLTRYAVNELNGFPPWFETVAARFPTAVGNVLSECVRGDWAHQEKERERWDVIHRITWAGFDVDPLTRSTLLELLRAGDPAHRFPLNCALEALFQSSDPPFEELREIAARRFSGNLDASPMLAQWFAVWVQLDPIAALNAWEDRIQHLVTSDKVMISVCAALNGRDARNGPRLEDQSYLTAQVIGKFLRSVGRHVRFNEDIDRSESGGYTPGDRDFAQEFRDSLFRRLSESSDPGGVEVLAQLADEPSLASRRDYLLHLREQLLERVAEVERWRPSDVRRFAKEHETDPYTDFDLYRIGRKRLFDIKNEVERSDTGLRSQIADTARERDLRIWLANELTRRRMDRYVATQEVEIDQQQHPDIRLENPRAGYVPIEIKLASEWPVRTLLERLENQLFGQYLRAHDARYGFFVLGLVETTHRWDNPQGGRRLIFPEVLELLEAKAAELSAAHGGRKHATVIGIGFRNPPMSPVT